MAPGGSPPEASTSVPGQPAPRRRGARRGETRPAGYSCVLNENTDHPGAHRQP